jgi:hypothetical protein
MINDLVPPTCGVVLEVCLARSSMASVIIRKQGRTPHAALDFAVARTGLDRQEAYMLLSIIGELRLGTSPRPVMATRLIVPEE